MEKIKISFASFLQSTNKRIRKFNREVLSGVLLWVKNNKKEFIVLCVILGFSAFFRLFKIDQYMTFLGDEGRDVIIVRRFITEKHPMLIGPGTSIGNMYLGPLYYYLMAPALLLANFSPVGPAVQIAVLGVLTVFLVWYLSREWFGRVAGIVAAILYGAASVVIIYSKSSWNPNIMPFFAIICIYSLWKIYKYSQFRWFIVLGISFAFVLQSHYLGLLLLPIVALYSLLTILKIKLIIPKPKFIIKDYLKNASLALIVFLTLMSPLLFFDIRHGWNNFNAMKIFFTQRQTTVSANPLKNLSNIPKTFNKSMTSLVASSDSGLGIAVSLVLVLGLIQFVYIRCLRERPDIKIFSDPKTILYLWMLSAFVGLSLYKQEIYDHYYGFFFPAPFMAIGMLAQDLYNKASRSDSPKFKFILAIFSVLILDLIFVNLKNSPIRVNPNFQLTRTVEVSQEIIKLSNDKKFNFAVIAERNYEGAYKYFLLLNNSKVTDIDPLNTKDTITNQLFVVCELPKEKCDPTHNPKAEVANFGWSKIDSLYEVYGVRLYKLVHTQ